MKLEILGIDFVQTLMLHNGYVGYNVHIDTEVRHTKFRFFSQTLSLKLWVIETFVVGMSKEKLFDMWQNY